MTDTLINEGFDKYELDLYSAGVNKRLIEEIKAYAKSLAQSERESVVKVLEFERDNFIETTGELTGELDYGQGCFDVYEATIQVVKSLKPKGK